MSYKIKYEVWGDKDIEYLYEMYKREKLSLPKYQRGLAWSFDQKKRLIKTIHEGKPIGCILLSKISAGDSESYQIIDGLQRINTIVDFKENPIKYIESDSNILDNDLIKDIMKIYYEDKNIRNDFDESFENSEINFFYDTYKENKKNQFDFVDKIINKYKADNNDGIYTQIKEKAIKIFDEAKDKISLNNTPIPIIVYTGNDFSELSDIFISLNNEGTALSVYEILSAKWINYFLEFSPNFSTKLIDKLTLKYKAIENDEDTETKLAYVEQNSDIESEINLYEYFLSLSFELCETKIFYQQLTGKIRNVEIGFVIPSLLISGFDNRVDLFEMLYNKAIDKKNFSIFLEELYDKIKEIAEQLSIKLSKFLLNGTNSKKLEYLQPYSLYHIFVSYFLNKYEIIFNLDGYEEKFINESKLKNSQKISVSILPIKTKCKENSFAENFPKRLMYNIMSNYWKINRQSNDLRSNIIHNDKREIYWEKILKEDFKKVLSNYVYQSTVDEIDKTSKESFTSSTKTIAFMTHRLIYSKSNEYKKLFENEHGKLEYDHIVPKKILSEINKIDGLENKLPISSVINCTMLPKLSNIKKNASHKQSSNEILGNYYLSDNLQKILGIYDILPDIKDLSLTDQNIQLSKYFKDRKNSYEDFMLNLMY